MIQTCVYTDGHVTVPFEVSQKLRIKNGDSVVFAERDGEIVIDNAARFALRSAQNAFADAAGDFKVQNPDDVQELINEVRYGK